MPSYYIHTYQHASGHKQVIRRTVYQRFEREKAMENLAVLGGVLEPVESTQRIPSNSTKR